MKEAAMTTEIIEFARKESLPRPWLARSQWANEVSGNCSAANVKAAKIVAAVSHLGPSTTSVNG